MKKARTSRRRFLQLAAGASVASSGTLLARYADALTPRSDAHSARDAVIEDGIIRLEFDHLTRARIWNKPRSPAHAAAVALTDWAPSEFLVLANSERCDEFALKDHALKTIAGRHGSGTQLRLSAVSTSQIEKAVEVEIFDRYPGLAFVRVSYRNASPHPVKLHSWTNCAYALLQATNGSAAAAGPEFWSYAGSTHADRRDWVQPVGHGFAQDNFMGMSATDYGGGTPVADVWRRDAGIAVGHVELSPRLVSLPVRRTDSGASMAVVARSARTLAPGERLDTLETFVNVHSGDYFATLATYRRVMAERGLESPKPPDAAYESIWCAWGYQRDCTVQLIEDTLPKVQELGLGWAVIDDGWQSNVGDWNLAAQKFPRGEADMKDLVAKIRARNLKPRLWWAPLAVAPGSDVLHDHTDMLLLDREGAPQAVSWWNSFYLCPADERTVAYTLGLVRRFMGDWGYAGLKIDGQHLNGVAPCYNPAHRHARPEESVEKLPDFFQAVYQTALGINPEAVVEICPCGTSYSFFNMRSMNQAPASDPESSWQVRHKGKTLKALMGPSAAFAGDHVELSDRGDDFASTVGVGAVISTKFTWPVDPKPKDSFLLTPQREKLWRKWITLANERQLPRGTYRGELYDIGFDKPEAHVVERSGRLYYAFYANRHQGPVELRGLAAGNYRVRDYFNDTELGTVTAARNQVPLAFEHFCVLEALPA